MSAVEAARGALHGARRVLVITGAGVSAESGIPTFRGEGGLWEGHRAEELATPEAFARDPERVWRWYRWRREICNAAQPNAAHRALVALERALPELLLVTQNVDGLHARAGSRALVELHGSIDLARGCRGGGIFHLDEADPEAGPLVHHPHTGELARPHILWFGERYWPGLLERASAFARRAELCLVIGSSGRVWPPMALALHAQEQGAELWELNPEPSQISEAADRVLRGSATELLGALTAGL